MSNNVESFLIFQNSSIKQAMRQLSNLGEKDLFVVNSERKLMGALSDGDIRKWLLKEGGFDAPVDTICNKNPKKVSKDYVLEDVKKMMLELKIECVPVVDKRGNICEILTWDDVFAGHVKRHQAKLAVPVVIMAGGKGGRLDPFTKILPKPLIPIGEKPIIELIMEEFISYDVKQFYIAVFHKARMIKSYFEEQNGKYNISYIEEPEPLGTIGGLKLLDGKLKGNFLVTNCDVIIRSNYAELVSFHEESGYDLTLVVSCRQYQIPYGVCDLEPGGTLNAIKEKPEYDLLVNTGMYVMNDRIFQLIPKNTSFSIIDLISEAKRRGWKIGVFPISEKAWIDVGQWEEYHKSVKQMQERLQS